MTYQINSKKTLAPLKNSWPFYGFWFLTFIVLIVIAGYSDMIFFLLVPLIGLPLFLQVALHLNYYFHDRNIKLKIDYSTRTIFFQSSKESVEIPFDDIEVIFRYQGSRYPSPSSPHVIPTNFYHYNVIKTKDGLEYKFTDFIKSETSIYGVDKELRVVPFINFVL